MSNNLNPLDVGSSVLFDLIKQAVKFNNSLAYIQQIYCEACNINLPDMTQRDFFRLAQIISFTTKVFPLGSNITVVFGYELSSFYTTLSAGMILHNGQYLISNNCDYYAKLQANGSLVVYSWLPLQSPKAIWSSDSKGSTHEIQKYMLVMQKDGNLVIYEANQIPIWASDTWSQNSGSRHLALLNNGALTIFSEENQAVWTS